MNKIRSLVLLLICAGATGTVGSCSDALEPPHSPDITPSLGTGHLGPCTCAIVLEKSALSFTAKLAGLAPNPQTVGITNGGNGTLKNLGVGKIVYGPGASRWLSASLSSKVAPATLTFSVASSNLAKGTYTATVPVISGAAINSPQSVTVTLTVLDTPAITLAPGTVTFGATQGGIDPAAQIVAVTNDAAGTLIGLEVGAITYGPGATGWLTTATLSAPSAPATLTLQPTVGTLSAGTYTADVPVQSAVASNSPQTVAVTLTVGATAPFTGQWSGTYDYGLISAVLQQSASSVTGTINDAGGCIFGVSGVASGNSLSITNWVLQSGNGVACFIESATMSGSLDASGNTWSGTGATTYPGAGGPVTWTFSMSRVSGGP